MQIVFRPIQITPLIWTMLLLLVPLAFDSTVYEGAFLPKLVVFQGAIFLLLLLSLIKPQGVAHPSYLSFLIIIYIFVHLLTFFQTSNLIESTLQLSFYMTLFIMPLFVRSTLSIDQFYTIMSIAPFTGFLVALLGISQYCGWEIINIPSNAQPSATFFHRNAAAAYTICILPLAWMRFQNAQTSPQVFLQTSLLMLLSIFLIFTRTRAAWIALLGAGLLVGLLSINTHISIPLQKTKRILLIAICFSILLAAYLPSNIQGPKQVTFDEKKSSATTTLTSILTKGGHRGRLSLWQNTLTMIYENPLGLGLGNWHIYYPHYARGSHINVKAAPERPHNDLLWIASELGLFGFIIFGGIIFFAIKEILPLSTHQSLKNRTLAQSLLVLIFAYLIDGFFSFPRAQVVPSVFFWFAIAGCFLFKTTVQPASLPQFLTQQSILAMLVLACLFITLKRIQYDRNHLKVYIAERQNDWNTVIKEANLAHKVGTYRANTFIAQGRAYYRTGDLIAAEKAYKIGLSLHPNSLNAYNNLGIVYRQQGKNKLAIEAFQKALYLHPNFVEAYYNLGNVYTNLSQWDNALQAYQTAENKGLNMPQLYFKLGQVSYAKSNLKQAEQYFLKALKRDPNFTPAAQALKQITPSP